MGHTEEHEGSDEPLIERERQILARYGSLPKQNVLLRSQVKERKFFDSGDFAISKATRDSATGHPKTGKQHPNFSQIPHLSAPVPSDSNVESNANASNQHKLNDDLGRLKPGPQLRGPSEERCNCHALSWSYEKVSTNVRVG
ncbi:cAMP-regulated phosphoprotein/endosulfine conserved domain-containing protein [Cladophialophora immunda]|nr:cAMP-regulated phosphoprotein/endosulfine conserved domain-containing protein [Cladophialophora immunda]